MGPHIVYASIVSFCPESTLLIVNFVVVQSPGMSAGRAKEGGELFALVAGNHGVGGEQAFQFGTVT